MVRVFISPRRYVQGVGVLADIGKYIAPLGKRALVAWGPVVSEKFGAQVEQSLQGSWRRGGFLHSFPASVIRGQIGLRHREGQNSEHRHCRRDRRRQGDRPRQGSGHERQGAIGFGADNRQQ